MNGGRGTKVTVNGRFATPVVEVVLPEAAAYNEALREAILAREEKNPSVQHSNLGGWQSSWDLERWGGDAARRLLRSVRSLASRMTRDRAGKPVDVAWLTNAWANVNRTGNGNELHTHPGAFWSAAYYVDDGGAGADPSLGGEFQIQDPRGVAPAMLNPNLTFDYLGGGAAGASELIAPRAGLLLMFPSWLSHAVRPYCGDGTRISVSVNLTPAARRK